MWWLLIPPGIYAAKKIYDAFTEDDGGNSTYSKLSSQKEKRINVRKEAINQLLSRHRNIIKSELTSLIEEESLYLGEAAIDLSNDTTYKVKFTGFDEAISCLKAANNIILGKNESVENRIPSLQIITLKSANSSLVDQVIQKADSDYGSLSGIDSYDDYVESSDSFLDALKKMKTI